MKLVGEQEPPRRSWVMGGWPLQQPGNPTVESWDCLVLDYAWVGEAQHRVSITMGCRCLFY